MKALLFTLTLIIALLTKGHSQNNNSAIRSTQAPVGSFGEEIFTVCDEPPTFPGGQAGLDKFIQTNLRYPDIAQKKHVEGNVFIDFIINGDGTIRDVVSTRGIGSGAKEEAIRLVKSMPKWTPGKQSGRFVNFKYSLVIPFQSSDPK